jgi:hypothetical protein
VTAKTIEIHNGDTATCSGTARDMGSLLQTTRQLGAADGVSSVTIEQTRGKSPLQFTFDVQWGSANGGQQ